jgi:hypothetical protein
VLNGDLLWAVFITGAAKVHPATVSEAELLRAMLVTPVPLSLLITAAFYLWVYLTKAAPEAAF